VVSAMIAGLLCRQSPSQTAMSIVYTPTGRSPGGDSHQAKSGAAVAGDVRRRGCEYVNTHICEYGGMRSGSGSRGGATACNSKQRRQQQQQAAAGSSRQQQAASNAAPLGDSPVGNDVLAAYTPALRWGEEVGGGSR